jgi:DNA-binding PadR family transcriptional regulator
MEEKIMRDDPFEHGHRGPHEHGDEHGHGHGWGHFERRGRGFGFGWGPAFDWGGRGFERRGRGGPRGRRGNVRAAILALLLDRPMHGYEMISELEQRTGGVWRPSPGSVYPTLQLLEDEGLISSEESGGRRRFSLTDAGRTEAQAASESAPWEEFGPDERAEARGFKDAAFGIMDALRQVGFAGTDEQRARALDVLNETRRKLYAILAEEE